MPANGTVGDPQDIVCSITSTTLLDANSVTTSWTGPNGVTNDNRLTINATVDNNIYTSILHFDRLSESDEGIYTCNITTTDHFVSLSANFTDLLSKLKHNMHVMVFIYGEWEATQISQTILCITIKCSGG